MKLYKKTLMLLALAGIFSIKAIAQNADLPEDPDDDVPLDGGISLVIAAGIGYGAKRLMKNKNAAKVTAAQETTEK